MPGASSTSVVSASAATSTSDWPDPDRLHQDHVAAGRVQHPDRLRRRPRPARRGARGWPSSGCRRPGRWRGPASAPGRRAARRRRTATDGSTASTPTRWPCRAVARVTSAVVVVDLPTPGEPVRPMTWAPPGVAARARPRPRAAPARRPRPGRSAGRPPAGRLPAPSTRPASERRRAPAPGSGAPRPRPRGGSLPGRRQDDQRVALAAAAAQRGRADAAAAAVAAPAPGAARAGRRTCRSGGRARSRRR